MTHSNRQAAAFTLIELMVVVGIMTIALVLLAPAVTSMRTAGNFTDGVNAIASAVQQARAYAMANNTYTWVGFYEEDASVSSPTSTRPPYTGTGKVLVASVASLDGTKIFDESASGATIPAARIRPIGKLLTLKNVHITDVGSPSGGNPDRLDGRPSVYGGTYDHFSRISSDDRNANTTKFPFVAQGYTFYKTIRFSPRGEAAINSTYQMRPFAEIGVRPTHGTAVDWNTPNVAAIQFGGIAGNVKIYRR